MLCQGCHPRDGGWIHRAEGDLPRSCDARTNGADSRLGSMLPYRQAASVLAEFLPIEPTETHATVRKRTPALQLPTVFYAATGRQPPHYGWRHLHKINRRCLWLIEAARLWEPFLFLSGSS
jgi:hypothetical protein